MLGFNLVPDTAMLRLPEEVTAEFPVKREYYGTIIEWVHGDTFNTARKRGYQKPTCPSVQENMIEAYLFYLISLDADLHDRNIMIAPGQAGKTPERIFTIDHERTGSSPKEFVTKSKKFPSEIINWVANQPIPKTTRERLQRFVANQSEFAPQLEQYYKRGSVTNFFRIAALLSECDRVPVLNLGLWVVNDAS